MQLATPVATSSTSQRVGVVTVGLLHMSEEHLRIEMTKPLQAAENNQQY
jgi:hypothetical protein